MEETSAQMHHTESSPPEHHGHKRKKSLSPLSWVMIGALVVLFAVALTLPLAISRQKSNVDSTAAINTPTPNPCKPTAIYVPPCGSYHGVSTGQRGLKDFESLVNHKVDILHQYKTFDDYNNAGESFPGSVAQDAINGGRMYAWNWKPTNKSRSAVFRWADIAAGKYDASYINPTIDKIKAWSLANGGKKTFLLFHHEPENDTASYGTESAYAAAWRHVHNRFVAKGARDKIILAWVMTGYKARPSQWNAMYPGDAYVDWLGYEPYSMLCSTGASPSSFEVTFGEHKDTTSDNTGKYRFYKWATGKGAVDTNDKKTYVKPGVHNKPIMIGEYGAGYSPTYSTNMANFFTQAKSVLSAGGYPQVKAWLYWEGTACHKINSTSAGLSSYKSLLTIPRFNQPRPY